MAIWASDTYADPYNRERDRGNCESDRRHIFNATTVAETPRFANPTLRTIASGWRVSGIYRDSAGKPDDRPPPNRSGVKWTSRRMPPARTFSGPAKSRRTHLRISLRASVRPDIRNVAAFTQPESARLETRQQHCSRDRAPGRSILALSRVFRFHEDQRLEFRA